MNKLTFFFAGLLLIPFVLQEADAASVIQNFTEEFQDSLRDNGGNDICDGDSVQTAALRLRVYNLAHANDCIRAWHQFDITSISDSFPITKVEFIFDTSNIENPRNCSYILYEDEPNTLSNLDAFLAISTNQTTLVNDSACTTEAVHIVDLGPNATAYANIQQGVDWFGIGWKMTNETLDADNHQLTIEGAPVPPTLRLTWNDLQPDSVTDLIISNLATTTLDLTWSTPDLHSGTLNGSQINFTTPHGDPLTVITNNTNSLINAVSVSGLLEATDYSFRVSVWTEGGNNASGNIANTTTVSFGNFTVGAIDIEATNLDFRTWIFVRTDLNSSAYELSVIYPNTYNATCQFHFKFANVDINQSNLVTTIPGAGQLEAIFIFNNTANEVIDVLCIDETDSTNAEGRFLLTQTNFILLQQFEQFRDGTFGTMGMFGAIDLITLFGVVFATIGFNRINESVGGFFMLVILGVMAFFQIIVWPTALSGAIAVVVMLVVMSTRKV